MYGKFETEKIEVFSYNNRPVFAKISYRLKIPATLVL